MSSRQPSGGPPKYARAVIVMCFGLALLLVALLLYVSNPSWF